MNLLSARSARDNRGDSRDATAIVSALYAEHALGLTRLAQVMLGDRSAAEDVVHDAFFGLCRRWNHLADTEKAPAYLRSAVLNGCRSALRRQARKPDVATLSTSALSADVPLLASEDRRAVMAALRRLPSRQREALVLRYYLDLPDTEIAQAMGIGESTVRSTAHRGLAALERIMTEEPS
ncbi:MAG: sigma-70 family RNA polymerase sigma factor [Streptosporangiaceae bacterium]|jgi:RNA polymerase sigma-70 factor (sigma-E family)